MGVYNKHCFAGQIVKINHLHTFKQKMFILHINSRKGDNNSGGNAHTTCLPEHMTLKCMLDEDKHTVIIVYSSQTFS